MDEAEQTVTLDPTGTDDFATQLIRELDATRTWPLAREKRPREIATEGRALRKQDRDWLKRMCNWDTDRDYIADGLPKRIAFGFADFLFGDDLTITAASGADTEADPDDDEAPVEENGEGDAHAQAAQEEIDRIIEVTRMPALLHRAERIVVSEGEAYWKLHVNKAVADCALLTWSSRRDTVPLFYGDMLIAAAFITERRRRRETYLHGDSDPTDVVYRHAEIHCNERVVNVLYRGTDEQLGARISLTAIPETAAYQPEWVHGLPMLAGRVVNDLDDNPEMGESEYATVRDELLALNEALTIAVENARLTGKDRIFSAGRFMQANGTFDASLEVFQVESDNSTLGEGDGTPPIVAVEKRYDAQPLWLHITSLVKTVLSRVGLVPQWIGEEVQGAGESGLAIRLRFIPTTNAAKGKNREWKHAVPHIVDLQLRIASLPITVGGFGKQVAQDEPPAVEFADPIPADTSRDILDTSAAVVSEIMSRYTAIKTQHPEWTDEQVQEELDRIDKDKAAGQLPAPPPPFNDVKPPTSARG